MLPSFLTTILFSISIVCGHRSAKMIGGTEANFWRLVCATTFLGLWSWLFGVGMAGVAFPTFLMSGILGIGVGDVALFQALPRLGSRLSLLLIQCLTAPFAAIIEWLWLGTSLTALQIICGLTILAGVGLALTPGEHLKLSRRELVTGTLFSLVAALGGAFGAVLSRKAYAITHAANEHINGANAAFQRILGGLLIGSICLLIVKRRELRIQRNAPSRLVTEASKKKWRGAWPWVLMNSLAGQTLGVSCMQWAFETTPTGLVLAIIATTPIVVIPFAWTLEGERPNLKSVAGGVLAVAGVVALMRQMNFRSNMTANILILMLAMTISSRAAAASGDANHAIDALFADYARPNSPGASLLVLRNGKPLVTRSYGLANLEEKTPCAPKTNFRLASVTKQFTATAILLLIADKKLDLSEPLTVLFPEFPAYGKQITVRHLLNHTSGLPDYEELIPPGTSLAVLDRDVLRILMKQEKTLFPPGSKFQYSNSGYSLLALIVEARSGLTFANFLKTRIFQPLKMLNTLAYEQGLSTVPNRAYGYSDDANSFKRTDQSLTSSVLGDGGIYSSVIDLARWDQGLQTSKLLGQRLQQLAFTPGPATEHSNTRYGFGWYIGEYRGLKEIWHSGNSIGFTTRIARLPEKNFTVIILANRSDAAIAEIPHRIADLFLFGK